MVVAVAGAEAEAAGAEVVEAGAEAAVAGVAAVAAAARPLLAVLHACPAMSTDAVFCESSSHVLFVS